MSRTTVWIEGIPTLVQLPTFHKNVGTNVGTVDTAQTDGEQSQLGTKVGTNPWYVLGTSTKLVQDHRWYHPSWLEPNVGEAVGLILIWQRRVQVSTCTLF